VMRHEARNQIATSQNVLAVTFVQPYREHFCSAADIAVSQQPLLSFAA
jgi:hypothetical protein